MEQYRDNLMANKSASAYDYTINAVAGCQGLVICVGNGLLLATIITEKSLRSRKEMRIVAGLAVADLLVGGGALSLAIYRLIVLGTGYCNLRLFTAWDCIRLPPTVSVYVGGQLTVVMNLIVSVDRYLAVAKPLLYRRLENSYTRLMLGIAGTYTIITLASLLLSTYFGKEQLPSLSPLCTGWVIPTWYGTYQFGFVAILSCTSVAIYAAIFFAYKKRRKSTVINRRAGDQHAAIQRRLTVTVGIISVFTLTFYAAPTAYMAVLAIADVTTSQPYQMAILTRISTIANLVIYICRQEEIRAGMWKFIACRLCGAASWSSYIFTPARTLNESSRICRMSPENGEPLISQNDLQLGALHNVMTNDQ